MSNRAAIAWLAAALFVGALIAGLMPVHANDISCGSAFSASADEARVAQYGDDLGDAMSGRDFSATDYAADCESRVTAQRTFTFPVLIIGALAGGFLILTTRRDSAEDQSPRAK